MMGTGVNRISLDYLVDVDETVEGKAAIIGNINPANTLFFGTSEAVKEESLECIRKGVNILTPNCGIPTRTSLKNIKAMVDAARESTNK